MKGSSARITAARLASANYHLSQQTADDGKPLDPNSISETVQLSEFETKDSEEIPQDLF